MKQYVIMRLADGMFFCCRSCEFRVKVGKGNDGSARTIAATEINEHIATVHEEHRP